jgi:hypothetical protein
LFSVQSVTNQETGAPVEQVTLSAFTFNSKAVAADEAFEFDEIYVDINGGSVDMGATILENEVLCAAPCTFGYNAPEGTYGFTVSAEGYTPEQVTIKAAYKPLPPSQCGSGHGNLVKFDFVLVPSSLWAATRAPSQAQLRPQVPPAFNLSRFNPDARRASVRAVLGLRVFLGEVLLPQGFGQSPHPRLGACAGIRVAEAQVVERRFDSPIDGQTVARQIDVRQEHVTLPKRLHRVQVAQGFGVGCERALPIPRLGERAAAPKMSTCVVKKLAHTAPFRVIRPAGQGCTRV